MLHQGRDYDDIAEDLEGGATEIHDPERMPQHHRLLDLYSTAAGVIVSQIFLRAARTVLWSGAVLRAGVLLQQRLKTTPFSGCHVQLPALARNWFD